MRDYCLDCVIKHLGQAYVMHIEAENGYPEHFLGVIGHLAEAAEECQEASTELANEIRQNRLLILENIDKLYNGEKIKIPYFMLYNKIMSVRKEKGCGNCKKGREDFKERLKKLVEKTENTV